MAGQPTSQSSSDNFWPEPSELGKIELPPRPKKPSDLKEFLAPVDESPDFHDPYSELNLFLAKQIKEVFREAGFVKKWSGYLQEKLIEKIAPEFQKKFPSYRLGASSLRKLWEKIAYYSEQIAVQKEAISSEGKLNVAYLIKENLKQYFQYKSSADINPYHFAHQLALKISDCMATMEGVRPTLDHLSRTIWAVEKQMLPAEALAKLQNPYDDLDKWDKLVVKTILEISGKHPQLSQKELEALVKEAIISLQDLPSFASLDRVAATISALLASRFYPSAEMHTLYVDEQKQAALRFIRRHIELYKKASPLPQFADIVRRTIAIYTLAAQLPKDLDEKTFFDKEARPQAVSAFIAAEVHLQIENPSEIFASYEEAKLLPQLASDQIELAIWHVINEIERLLDALSYRVGQRIDEEITHILIDNPNLSFQSIVATVVQFFKKAKELAASKNMAEIEKKISIWTHQGDLLCRWLKLENDTELLHKIVELQKQRDAPQNHTLFLSRIAQDYFNKHPHLAAFAPQVMARIAIFYKYAWYALFSSPEESSVDRFIRWHFTNLGSLGEEQKLLQLEEIFKKMIPLVPFDRPQALKLLAQQKVKSEENERHAQ